MEINYDGTPVKGKGLDHFMRADHVKDPGENPGYGGDAKLQLASDAFFTWLALTPDKFWVSLDPIRPDVIRTRSSPRPTPGASCWRPT
ncbi:hypothetical protein ACFRQM_15370 [Streptomyces sp. NPDC056831]|uniref:hypothetical protein n=1 Tax=Streptomyces sp. NPDC056831 TaxID=3345954 RepID=UPI00369FB943